MSATVSYAKARELLSADEWTSFIQNPNRWRIEVDGQQLPPGTDFAIRSKFGAVMSAVVLQPNGASFDRPLYVEAPFGQHVLWYKADNGRIYFGLVEQPRPHADDPEHPGADGHVPIRCLNVVMGFDEKTATGKFETPEEAARRETGQEAGTASAIIGSTEFLGVHNPSPSFTKQWGNVTSTQVDLKRLEKPIPDPDEPINGVYFIEAGELLKMIAGGTSEAGAYLNTCTSLSALLVHFAHHPDHWPRSRRRWWQW